MWAGAYNRLSDAWYETKLGSNILWEALSCSRKRGKFSFLIILFSQAELWNLSLDFTMKVKPFASINKIISLNIRKLPSLRRKQELRKTENRINQVYHFDFFFLSVKMIWGPEIAFVFLVTTSLLICWCYFSVSKSMHGEELWLYFVLKPSLFLTGITLELLCQKEAANICP